jgi:hypothetical protein
MRKKGAHNVHDAFGRCQKEYLPYENSSNDEQSKQMSVKARKKLVLLTALFLLGCVPPQHRLDFDLKKNALVSCNSSTIIRHLSMTQFMF